MSYEIKNVYTIFFASSITELEFERLKLTNFVNGLSAHYLEKFFEIRLLPIICEDEDPCMAHAGKQAEYDQAIRDSRMCFFVFYKKVGEYTVHELEVAKAAFDSTELPKIYFFFKKPHGEEFSSEVVGLQSKLDKDFGHYYNFFDDIDTVHLRIVLQIMQQVLPEVSVKLKDGKVTANDLPIPGVDPMSLPEFKNNRDLARLREEYDELAAECEALSEEFKQPNCPTAIIEDYARKAARKASLQEEIRQLLDNIFNISKEICSESGVVDAKRRAAYRYLEEGDSKKALELLDAGELSEASNRLLSRADMMDAEAQSLIDSWKLRIDILLTMTEDSQRFEKARAAYETIEKLVDKFRIGTEEILDYASFLSLQKDYGLAHEKLLKCVRLLEAEKSLGKAAADETLGIAYASASILAQVLHAYAEARAYCEKVIEIWEKPYAENPSMFIPSLAMTYNGLGILNYNLKEYGKAQECYEKALEIWEKFYAEASSVCAPGLALSCSNLGGLHRRLNEYYNAREYYEKALRLWERLYAENPSAYVTGLATTYVGLAYVHKAIKEYSKALKYHKDAIGIQEQLYKENPSAYAPDLATNYNNLGFLHQELNEYDKARECYEKALRIRERFYGAHPTEYASDLLRTYESLGNLCNNLKEYSKAREYYEKALRIRERLYEAHPATWAPFLATTYVSLAYTHKALKEYGKAREYYEKALGIRERLYEAHPATYAPDLALTYNNLGWLHKALKDYDKAREYREKALEILEKLYAENPSAHASNLAGVYGNLAEIYEKLGKARLAKGCRRKLKSLKR